MFRMHLFIWERVNGRFVIGLKFIKIIVDDLPDMMMEEREEEDGDGNEEGVEILEVWGYQ